jgi:hypothetical protein
VTEEQHQAFLREKDNDLYTKWEREAKAAAQAKRRGRKEHRPARHEAKR